jgi:acyl-CoA synthetase (AMP-forming)/AMP-acid ligase II
MPLSYSEAVQNLTAPGAPFELITETVRGLPMRIFKNREKSMREKVATAGLRGETDFLVQGSRRISYGEFARLVWGTAAALRDEQGLRRGDRLAILSFNSPDWLIALFAATSLGGIGVGLNGWWTTEEIEYGLRDSGSRFLVVDERLFPRVAPLLGKLPDLERVFYIGSHPPAGVTPIAEILRSGDQVPTEPIAEDDPFVILYTSGTTGRSKGCITTHRGTITQVLGIVFANVVGMLTGGGTVLPGDGRQATGLLTSPLFHVGGLHSTFCTSMTAGAKVVFNSGKFDEEEVMGLIQSEHVTLWSAIPTMLHRVVHSERVRSYDLSSLRSFYFLCSRT